MLHNKSLRLLPNTSENLPSLIFGGRGLKSGGSSVCRGFVGRARGRRNAVHVKLSEASAVFFLCVFRSPFLARHF